MRLQVRRCFVVVVAVTMTCAGCSSDAGTNFELRPGSTSPPVSVTSHQADLSAPIAVADTSSLALTSDQVSAPSRSAIDSMPFGNSDIDPRSLVVDPVYAWPSIEDSSGAFWLRLDSNWNRGAGHVLDICDIEDLRTLRYGNSQYLPESGRDMTFVSQLRRGAGCDNENAAAETVARYVYVATSGQSPFFPTRAEAAEWGKRYESESQEIRGRTLPEFAKPIGFYSVRHTNAAWPEQAEAPYFIRYAGNAQSPQGVHVIEGSLLLRDGVMRGLVRNWSPTHFAYDLEVSVGDRMWRWPLSVQPGEVAPFEFRDWETEMPSADDFGVLAVLSMQLDQSRGFVSDWEAPEYREGSLRDLERNRNRRPAAWLAALDDDQMPLIGRFVWNLNPYVWSQSLALGESHPSLADIDVGQLPVDDFRGYGAIYDTNGRVVALERAVIVGEHYQRDSDGNRISDPDWPGTYLIQYGPVSRLPLETGASIDLHFAARDVSPSDSRYGGVLLWIGGAHPPLAELLARSNQ